MSSDEQWHRTQLFNQGRIMSIDKTISPRPLFVRCDNRMVFPIHRGTYEATACSRYDAYCFSHPCPAVDYIEYSDWLSARASMRDTRDL